VSDRHPRPSVPRLPLPLLTLSLGVVCAGLWLFAGCPGDDGDSSPGDGGSAASTDAGSTSGGIQDSWMFRVVEAPERLAPMEKQGEIGNAWLSLYHNDLRGAARSFESACTPSAKPYADRAGDGFPCIGYARAQLELAHVFEENADIDRVARRQFYAHRRDRPEDVLASTHQDYFEGLTLLRSGDEATGRELLTAYVGSDGKDELLAFVAQKLLDGWGSDPLVERIWGTSGADAPADATLGSLPDTAETAAYKARLQFMEALAKGDVEGAEGLLRPIPLDKADLLETLEQGEGAEKLTVSLFHFDSSFLRAYARYHALEAEGALGGAADLELLGAEARILLGRDANLPSSAPSVADGLAFVVFSGWLTPDDRRTDLAGGRPASLVRLGKEHAGLSIPPKDKVSDLDAFIGLSNQLKGQLQEAIRGVGPEGGSMDTGMGLSERFLGRLLLDGALDVISGMDVRLDAKEGSDMETAGVGSRALLEAAMDKNPSPPSQLLKRARISFRNDPPLLTALARANLDTKRPYYANDYVRPLTEAYPELIPVREGLAALDSAWNPARAGAVR